MAEEITIYLLRVVAELLNQKFKMEGIVFLAKQTFEMKGKLLINDQVLHVCV